MKATVISLLRRNALVVLGFALLLTACHLVPRKYIPPPWLILPGFFVCLLWANGAFQKRGHLFPAVLLSLLFVPAFGFPVLIASNRLGRSLVERECRARGFELVTGCNLAAAVHADFQVSDIEQRLPFLTNAPSPNTNLIARLHAVYPVALEKQRSLSDDCCRRGHCDDHLWKTNWVVIKEALDAADTNGW